MTSSNRDTRTEGKGTKLEPPTRVFCKKRLQVAENKEREVEKEDKEAPSV